MDIFQCLNIFGFCLFLQSSLILECEAQQWVEQNVQNILTNAVNNLNTQGKRERERQRDKEENEPWYNG